MTSVGGSTQGAPGPDIKVICRILDSCDDRTPHPTAPPTSSTSSTIEILDPQTVRLPVITVKGKTPSDGIAKKNFVIHEVFSSKEAPTEQVYASTLASAVQSVMADRPATVLSYGAEKTGKSYTLFGPTQSVQPWDRADPDVGLVSRTIHDLFEQFAGKQQSSPGTSCCIQLAMLAVLKNDTIQDLLTPARPGDPEMLVRVSTEEDHLIDVDPHVVAAPFMARSCPVSVGPSLVISGLSYLITNNQLALCQAINDGLLNSKDLKGDKVIIINVLQDPAPSPAASPRPSCTSFTFFDCSPVYSKSMHNLRDIANSLANKHKNAEYMKTNMTRLLKFAFTGNGTLRLLVHCKVSSFDLDLFDSLSSLNFSALVMKIHKNLTEGGSPRSAAPDSPPAFSASAIQRRLAELGGTTVGLHTPAKTGDASPQRPSLSPPPVLFSEAIPRNTALPPSPEPKEAPSGTLSPNSMMQAESLMQSSVISLVQQMKEKEEKLLRAYDSIDQLSALLQKSQEKNKSLEERLDVTIKLVKQFESQKLLEQGAVPRAEELPEGAEPRTGHYTDDHAAFVDCTIEEEKYVLSHLLPPGGTASAILSPMRRPPVSPGPGAAGGPIGILARSPVTGRNSPVSRSSPVPPARLSPSPLVPSDDLQTDVDTQETEDVDDGDDGSETSGSGSFGTGEGVEITVEEVEQHLQGADSDTDHSLVEDPRVPGPAKLQRRMVRLQEKVTRLKRRVAVFKRVTHTQAAQLNHQISLTTQYAQRLEEEEKRSQEHVVKTIALSTRLEETKKWVRKLKKAVQAEKEKTLPLFNEQLQAQLEMRRAEERRQEEFRRQCDTFIEQQNTMNHELQLKREKIESLEAALHAVSNQYTHKLTAALEQSEDWQHLVEAIRQETDGRPEALEYAERIAQLRAENEALRSNVEGVMQVVNHCYEENARLASLTSKLTRSLQETNDWHSHWPSAEGGGPQEERYLKQIASLHFQLLRLRKRYQEAGLEIEEDAEEEVEEDSGTGFMALPESDLGR
eukprot:TRINITY_DN4323_c0_g1_i1.p1 TRINITY_DN4323_c0_g1~~TRINITY_DN4323_c0_g1_i1.p1  ORF type:complete len:1033 (-),score=201.63 TRINITY_DN4323_c0_g1_i1:135-3191(-)